MKVAFALFVVFVLILAISIIADIIICKTSGSCQDAFLWLKTKSVGFYYKPTTRDLKRFKEARIRQMEASLDDLKIAQTERERICKELEHCRGCKFCDCSKSVELEA